MNSNSGRFNQDIDNLIKEGIELLKCISDKNDLEHFKEGYEAWYSEGLSVIDVILPKRKSDFMLYYNSNKNACIRKVINQDCDTWGLDIDNNTKNAVVLFANQLNILKASQRKFKSSLFDIQQLVYADLFNNELEVAIELNKKKS